MSVSISVAVYLTLWWVVFLAILPMGTVSHAEAGVDKHDGGDPGAPLDPKLKRKVFTTTWVALIPFSVVWLVVYFHLIALPSLAGMPG
jgi:predicted secreted protein